MRLRLFFRMAFAVMAAAVAPNAQEFYGKGGLWLGGGVAANSMEVDDQGITILQAAPIVRYFVFDRTMAGPSLAWTGQFGGGESSHLLGLGGEIGRVLFADPAMVSYARTGGRLALLTSDSYWEPEDRSRYGFTLPLAVGILLPVKGPFAVQVEGGFAMTWIDEQTVRSFAMSLGFCGLGERAAVSVLQGLGMRGSFF